MAVIDTGISYYYGGRLSALEIVGGELRPLYFEQSSRELPATQPLKDRLELARMCAQAGAEPDRSQSSPGDGANSSTNAV